MRLLTLESKILSTVYKNEGIWLTKISKILDITYSHLVKLVNKLEKEGFVQLKKAGRTKFVSLTEKGKAVAEHIIKIEKIVEDPYGNNRNKTERIQFLELG